jgi:mRNA interferase MazF
MDRIIKRGEIYYAELNPVIGSEQGGTRPVLIISNNTGNRYSPTVIIAAITSRQTKSKLPTHYDLNGVSGLPADSIVLLEQIRTIDKKRLKERLARLDSLIMEAIAMPLLISIGVKADKPQAERRASDV